MSENIQSVNLNFSNSGGGHSASVQTVVDGKKLGGEDGLGTVVGEVGEQNSFSDAEIDRAMQRFACTSITTTRDPTKTIKNRKYIDKTTLKLDSMVVLVRGVNCAPEGGEANLSMPFFTEVVNSPLRSFKAQGAVRKGSVIEVGRIYNFEEASDYRGVKAYMVYNNKVLKKDLSLNLDFVNEGYKAGPDLSQFQLKFGYTLSDFRSIMEAAGIGLVGLPANNDFNRILFQNSGTLTSVVSSIASSLGCFWYVDPSAGGVRFINTAIASTIPIKNWTKTGGKGVVGATFTEDLRNPDVVNVYTGSTEKKPEGSGSPSHGDGARTRNACFRRLQIESLPVFRTIFQKKDKEGKVRIASTGKVLGTYFALWNQRQQNNLFDLYTYVLLFLEASNAFKKNIGDEWQHWTIKPLYKETPCTLHSFYFSSFKMMEDEKVRAPEDRTMFPYIPPNQDNPSPIDKLGAATKISALLRGGREAEVVHRAGRRNQKGFLGKYINKFFVYFKLTKAAVVDADEVAKKEAPLESPKGTDLFKFLDAYFTAGWGIWISNGYSTYKAERMEFQAGKGLEVMGPFKRSHFIDRYQELAFMTNLLAILCPKQRFRVRDLAEHTNPKAVGHEANEWHFIAKYAIPDLPRIPDKKGNVKEVELDEFKQFTEIFQLAEATQAGIPAAPYIGGPRTYWAKIIDKFMAMIKQSYANYSAATQWNKSMGVKYNRSKTRVNKLTDEGEEKEDDDIAESSPSDQKTSDLFDRFDTRYYGVEAPAYNTMNKLSLSSSSGSTLEMMLLREKRKNYEGEPQRVFQSSRTIYGLQIPEFEPQMNSITLNVSSNGVTTTVNESTIKLIPPDQGFIQGRAMESLSPKNLQGFKNQLDAGQMNFFGL